MARREPGAPQREQDGRLPLSAEVDRLAEGPSVRRWPVVAVVVLLVVVGAATWVEGRRRAPSEESALAACADRAEQVTSRAETRLATTASYVAPALGSGDAALHESMLGLVSGAAAEVVGPVEEALARCRGVDVWPFNRSHARTRAAFVDYLTAERRRLRAVMADGAEFDTGYDEVRRLATRAEARLAE